MKRRGFLRRVVGTVLALFLPKSLFGQAAETTQDYPGGFDCPFDFDALPDLWIMCQRWEMKCKNGKTVYSILDRNGDPTDTMTFSRPFNAKKHEEIVDYIGWRYFGETPERDPALLAGLYGDGQPPLPPPR